MLAKKRICIDFVSHKDGQFLCSVMQHVIEEECLKRLMADRVALNGNYLEPVVTLDEEYVAKRNNFNIRTRRVANQCLAKVTICLYLQLLVSEFSRDPQMPWIRKLIAAVFANE